MEAGSTTALASGDMLVASTTARSDHVSVGSLAPVKFTATGRTTVRIGGIYQANALIGNYLVSNNYFGTHFLNEQPAAVLLRTDGESGADGRVKAALSACPSSCSARRIGRYHDRINGLSHSRNWPSPFDKKGDAQGAHRAGATVVWPMHLTSGANCCSVGTLSLRQSG